MGVSGEGCRPAGISILPELDLRRRRGEKWVWGREAEKSLTLKDGPV